MYHSDIVNKKRIFLINQKNYLFLIYAKRCLPRDSKKRINFCGGNFYSRNAFSFIIWTNFYELTRLPVTRWVKLSLNFELLVNREMKFLLGQRLFNNIFCAT